MNIEIITSDLLNVATLIFMGITGLAIARIRSLFAVVMLSGIYSLLGATLYVILDAVDVAFTEAAVGAGASTVLMIGTLALTSEREKATPNAQSFKALAVCSLLGLALVYARLDMPLFGEFFQGLDTALKTETGQPIMTSLPIADVVAYLREIQE